MQFVGVRPDHRRSGLACGLYEDFARYAQEQGCTEMQAITARSNTGSIRFHQGLGFRVIAPVAGYNGPGRPMVTFRRQLRPATDR